MRKGFTLIEVMVVVLIFTFLFAAILTILVTSNRSWQIGKDKLIEQQAARMAMDNITRLLRQSRPEWVTISSAECPGSRKILFYVPVFNEAGDTVDTRRIMFKPNPSDCLQLLRKEEGDTDWTNVATELKSINFSGGDCVGCSCDFTNPACSNCTNVTDSCPVVKIDITTERKKEFILSSYITLRNYNISLPEVPEPPAEGEF